MTNPYFVQLIGILLTGAGVVALTAASRIFGRPLTHEEKRETGKEGNWYRLPFNLETIASGALFLAGIGILTWSKFNLCAFLAAKAYVSGIVLRTVTVFKDHSRKYQSVGSKNWFYCAIKSLASKIGLFDIWVLKQLF